MRAQLATVRCERCGSPFTRRKLLQRFCSQRCQRAVMKARRRERLGKPIATCANSLCGKQFEKRSKEHKFCSDACRHLVFRGTQPPRARKRLICKWCRGRHLTSSCPHPAGTLVKQYGALGPNREYVPPDGVQVRMMQIPRHIDGERLSQILKELDP